MRVRGTTPFEVVCVVPRDGACGVLRDDPIVLLLSGPVDVDCLEDATLEVQGEGRVPVRVETLGGGRALILRPSRALDGRQAYRLQVKGLRDARGREAPAVHVGFTTGALAGGDLQA